METNEERVIRLLSEVKGLKNEIAEIGFEYFILKCIDDKFELEILDNTITALRSD